MLPAAYVVHRTRQRVRLRVPEKRGDEEWFVQTAVALGRLSWVDRVETAAVSASLILHCGDSDRLDECLSQTGVLMFLGNPPRVPSAAEQVKSGVARLDRALQSGAPGNTDLRSLLFLLMLVLAGVQMARGQVLVPAISLVWYAMELALGAQARQRPEAEVEPDGEP